MKRLALALLILASCYAGATACPTGYSWYSTLSVPAQAGLSGNLTSKPVVWLGDANLKTVGNGGNIQSSTGLDVVFCDGPGTGNLLAFELVANTYTATTGAGEWWILMPTISKTTTQTIYAVYGKSSATDQSCGASGFNNCGSTLWSGYLGVFHAGTSSTLSVLNSTLGTTATNNGVIARTGQINGAMDTGISNSWLDAGGAMASTTYTYETWGGSASAWPSASVILMSNWDSSQVKGAGLFYNGALAKLFFQVCSGTGCSAATYSFGPSGGTFYHLAMTYNGGNATSTGSYTGYLNGASQTMSMFSTSTTTMAAPTTDLLIGKTAAGNNFQAFWPDEIRIYGGVLSADWIKDDYTNQNSPSTYWNAMGTPTTISSGGDTGCIFIICT